VTACERLLALLADGSWHSRTEVGEAGIHYPDAWVRVLRESGHQVDATEQGFRLLRPVEAPEA
jgi:biotin operon repressor